MGTMPEKVEMLEAIRAAIDKVMEAHVDLMALHLERKLYRVMYGGEGGEECGLEEKLKRFKEILEDPAEIK